MKSSSNNLCHEFSIVHCSSEHEWSSAHTTCGCQGGEKRGESSYYHLHCKLDDSFLFHFFSQKQICIIRIN